MRPSTSKAVALSALVATVNAAQIQLPGLTLPASAAANRQLVVNTFQSAFSDYTTYAYKRDALEPVTKSWSQGRNGWGASIFDGMTTMKIMNLTTLFSQAVTFAESVDFSYSHTEGDTVSFFETTIRYLGSMLSAYELNGRVDAGLLANAKKLGDKLVYAFHTADGPIPYGSVNFATNTAVGAGGGGANGIAAAGSNVLEFYTLSKLTGNSTYQTLADNAMAAIANNAKPYPGLAVQGVNPSGSASGSLLSWDGSSDSYFEYLIKYGKMTNNTNPLWQTSWAQAVDSSIKHLLSVTSTATGSRTYLGKQNGGTSQYNMGDLTCFAGGNWIMGGKILGNQTIVNYGLNLTDSCMNIYSGTPTGMGGGSWQWVTAGGQGTPPSGTTQTNQFNAHGYYLTNNQWYLRPEVIESAFYAWRVTGDVKYQNWAATTLNNMIKYAKAPVGFSSINDVTNTGLANSNLGDYLESFFFAEVMKYMFLMFDDPAHISLDNWIFNTESHPLQAI